jgi:hypothetical protein
MIRLIGLLILATLAATNAIASTDPFIGRWKLDISRSKYPGDTCPTSMVIEMKAAEHGIWYRSDAIYRNGGEIHAQYSADYDGKQAMVSSAHGMLLPVSLKRINSNMVEATYRRGIEVIAVSRRVVSPDGRSMKITTTSFERTGRSVTTAGVYTKVSASE